MRRCQNGALVSFYVCCGLSLAQQSSPPASVPSPRHVANPKTPLDGGSIINGIYRNNSFHFSYQLPFGWVDRTSEMREDIEDAKSKVLLSTFERPPAAPGDTVNSAVIIAAESASSYPGLKTAADYFGPLTELAETKGLKATSDPYDFPVDGRAIVRRDFSKDAGKISARQSCLVMMSRGYVLSFTFVAGSEDDIAELIEKLKFAGNAH